jgi:hypothetical protein
MCEKLSSLDHTITILICEARIFDTRIVGEKYIRDYDITHFMDDIDTGSEIRDIESIRKI